MRSFLLVAVVLLASRIHSTYATCAGAGYDVSVVDRDLLFNTTEYEWWFHPCGSVSSASSAVCGSTTLFPYGSMLCQRPQGSSGAYNLATYNSTTPVLWTETSAHNGVEYRTQDGDMCGSFRREVTARFQCDPTATTPSIVSITEVELCWYTVVVKTSSACSAVGNTAPNTVGSSMWSTQCGAGIYDLGSVSANDMVWQDTDYIWYVRLCGTVSNTACSSAQPTSVCQQSKSALGSPTDASHFNTSEAALWSVTANGMSVQIQDGAVCSAIGTGVRRQVTYQLICNPYITVSFISYISEIETCHYTVVIQSPSVCTGSNAPEMGYCGGVGADFSQITTDFYLRSGNYDWYIRPCGVLSPYTTTACGSKASACQVLINATSGNLVSVWNASIAHEAVTWTVLPQATSYSLQDGGLCGAISNHPRELTVKFTCDSTARTPVFQSITEVSTCYYTAVIRTALACYRQAPVDPNAIGYTYTDSVCGGERWDFSNIRSYGDLTYDSNTSSTTSGFMYVIDLCGRVSNTRCSTVQPTSFCQYDKANANTYSLSYMAANIDATYTINANGITMTYSDGTSCGGIPSRVAIITIICDGTTPPVLQSVAEVETCHYAATVRAQCVAGSTSPLDSSSSSSTGPVAPLVIPITAPTVSSCSGAGYDMTQDAQSEYVFTDANYNWYFRPCAVVSYQRSTVCGNAAQFPYGSMLCQQPINQTYAYNVAIYNSTTSPRWVAIPGGVSYSIQDGDFCGSTNFRREVNVVFVCDASATTAQLVGIVENELCWYQVTMRSARACNPVGPTGGNSIGSSFLSTQCGAGIYDLSSLSSADLFWQDNSYDWSLRLCGQVSNTNCSSVQPTSLCQYDRGTTAYDASHWNASDPAIWTITSTGLTAQIQDGTLCTAIGANAHRQVTFDLRCNNVVSVPYISYIKEIETCHYTVVIQTPAVCSGSNAPVNGICSGAGYDMSGLDTDLTLTTGGWNWFVRVCAPLSPYTTTACGAGVSVCQQSVANPSSAYPISYWNSSVAESVSWLAINNGVQYSVQDGAPCAAVGAAYRELSIKFLCLASASTPILESIVEIETCWYTATIRTSAACYKQAPVNTNAVGYSYNDFGCGGSRFASDFATLASQGDMAYDTNSSSSTSGWMIYMRMCGAVSNPLCNSVQPTSFCQIGKPTVLNSTDVYSLASMTSTTQVEYTLNSNGVTIFVADGTVCGGIPYRASSIQLVCDGTSPARIDSFREVEVCHYSAVVRASCSVGTSPNGGGSGSSSSSSSLSGGAIAGIVIGVIVGSLILLAVLFCVCFGQHRGNKKSDMSENHTGSGRFDSIEESRVENDPTEIEMGESGHTDD